MGTALLLAAVGFSASGEVAGRGLLDLPPEVQASNTVRISHARCETCVTLEEFYEAHRLGFVLFFERPLAGENKYKAAVIRGFHETCAELRWSRVVCGVVDMIEDVDYAKRYIDPKTAPAHIAVRDGQPVQMQEHHVKRLMDRPGDKETMLWHLRELLASDEAEGSLDIAMEAEGKEAFAELLRKHQVIVAMFATQKAARHSFCMASRELVLRNKVPGELHVPGASAKEAGGAGRKARELRKLRQRAQLKFVALSKDYVGGLPDGQVVAFLGGKLWERAPAAGEASQGKQKGKDAGGAGKDQDGDKMSAAIKAVLMPVVEAANKENKQKRKGAEAAEASSKRKEL